VRGWRNGVLERKRRVQFLLVFLRLGELMVGRLMSRWDVGLLGKGVTKLRLVWPPPLARSPIQIEKMRILGIWEIDLF